MYLFPKFGNVNKIKKSAHTIWTLRTAAMRSTLGISTVTKATSKRNNETIKTITNFAITRK